MSANAPATLLISRINSVIGFAVKLEIFVDDIKIGDIANGKQRTFNIEAGEHQVYARRGVWGGNKTKPVTIAAIAGETIKMSCGILGPVNIFIEKIDVVQELKQAEAGPASPVAQVESQHQHKGRQVNKTAIQVFVFLAVTVLLMLMGDGAVTWGDIVFSVFWGVGAASLAGVFIK
jgi:hypothetical protein